MEFNSDFKYDLKTGQVAEENLSKFLTNSKIEVKRDLKAKKTGNVFVEYYSRGKPSGISTSEAEWYCYFISDEQFVIVSSSRMKELCRKYVGTDRDVLGGDSNTSKGILLPTTDLVK